MTSSVRSRISVVTHIAFYETAAQLIPLLMFLLVFERRFLQAASYTRWWLTLLDMTSMVFVILLFVGGEAAALNILSSGRDPKPGSFRVVVVQAALIAELLFVSFAAAAVVFRPQLEAFKRAWREYDDSDD